MMNRRTVLQLSGGAVLATTLLRVEVAQAASKLVQPVLPYAETALEPVISARTVALHFGKHHKGYYDKLNGLITGKPYANIALEKIIVTAHEKNERDIFNNAAQAYNHNLYWAQFKDGAQPPASAFEDFIKRDFGSLEGLKSKILVEADKVFGTGWVWLARDNGRLVVRGYQDAGNPMIDGAKPLLGIDVWEHAYYLDYENKRAAHVKDVLDRLVNWSFVSAQWNLQQEG